MRRQLVGMVVAISSMILIALLVPMAVLIQRFAFEDALATAGLEVHAIETVVSFRERADLATFVDVLNAHPDGPRTTVLFADGDAIGPNPEVTAHVEEARATGQAISNDIEHGAEILVPVALGAKPGDPETTDQPVVAPPEIAVVRVIIDSEVVNRGVLVSGAVITGLEVSLRERADLATFVDVLNAHPDGPRTTVLFADGDAIGPNPEVTAHVEEARATGQAISNDIEHGAEILVPVALGAKPGDPETTDQPVVAPPEIAVVRVIIDSDVVNRGVLVSWAIITGLGVALLAIAVVVADRLARRLLRPVHALARTAEQLEAGRMDARADIAGPRELRNVGHALNRLAGRIGDLLAAERESVADISHRLRTPIAAARFEAEHLADPDGREAMTASMDAVSRELDHVIQEARRPMREGLGASCDAAAVVRDRTEFWSVLAEDQHRRMRVQVPAEPVPVKVAAGDLAAAVDALLENVFAHTADGVPFEVVLVPQDNGRGASLIVTDHGEGFPDKQAVLARGGSGAGSTGLGLDIVHRTAEAAGGRLVIENLRAGGARVIADLGPPPPLPAGIRSRSMPDTSAPVAPHGRS